MCVLPEHGGVGDGVVGDEGGRGEVQPQEEEEEGHGHARQRAWFIFGVRWGCLLISKGVFVWFWGIVSACAHVNDAPWTGGGHA